MNLLGCGIGLVEQHLAPHLPRVDLSDRGGLARQPLGMVLFTLLVPQPVVVLLRLAPVVQLGAQSPQHERHRDARLSHQAVDHVHRLVAVNPPRGKTLNKHTCTLHSSLRHWSIINHTHPFNGPLSGTTRVSWYQTGKTNLDFTEARDSEWQWHQLGHMQVCTSLQTDNHASTPPALSFLQAGCPSCLPTNSIKALKANHQSIMNFYSVQVIKSLQEPLKATE